MPEIAIYFPYIQPPDNVWFRQMLFYWDQVGTIVPSDQSNGLSSAVQEMCDLGLLHRVLPADYYSPVQVVANEFLNHISARSRAEKAKPRWSRFVRGVTEIHAEKLDGIAGPLVQMGLARQINHTWFEMPEWVAGDFMTFLACTIGAAARDRFQPITNNSYCEAVITGQIARPYSLGASNLRSRVREAFVDVLLPNPPVTASYRSISDFKKKHGKLLGRFRNEVEARSIHIAQISEQALREEATARESAALGEQRDEIESRIIERWRRVTFTGIFPLLSTTAKVVSASTIDPAGWISAVAGLPGAVHGAASHHRSSERQSMAYAARFQAAKKSGHLDG